MKKEAKMSKEMTLSLTKVEVEILEDALTSLVDAGYADEMSGAVQHLISGLQEKLEDVWCSYEECV